MLRASLARHPRALSLCAALCAALIYACGSGDGDSNFDEDGDANTSGGASGQQGASGGASGQHGGGGAGLSSGGGDGNGGASSGEPAVCATSDSVVERQPVYLDILLDDSGSMDGYLWDPTAGTNGGYRRRDTPDNPVFDTDRRSADNRRLGKRWLATREALIAYFEAQGAIASPRLGVGLDMFRVGTPGESGYLAPIGIAQLDSAHAARLTDMIDPPFVPTLGTFTLAALNRSLARFANFTLPGALEPGGRKAILLITDGVPSTNLDPRNLDHKAEVVRKIAEAAAADDPIVTAVIGIGETGARIQDYDPNFLSKAAHAGGLAPEGCVADWQAGSAEPFCHHQIDPQAGRTTAEIQADLTAAIDAISARLVSCELLLDITAEVDPATTNVVYTPESGAPEQLTADSDNGYSLDDPENPSKVILHGQSCEKLKRGGTVKVVLGCPAGHSVIN